MTAQTLKLARELGFTAKGKGAQAKALAFMKISALAYSETISRDASIANMQLVLGDNPTADEVEAARARWIIGRATARMPLAEFPANVTGAEQAAERMELVQEWKDKYQAPAKERKDGKASKLGKGYIGWRAPVVHKVIRAAESAASLFMADCGHGEAEGLKAKNNKQKKKRAPRPGSTGAPTPTPSAAPTHAELVQPEAPLSAADIVQHIVTQSQSLSDYANKHAKLCPTDMGTAIIAFRKAVVAAANAFQLRCAAAEQSRQTKAGAEAAKQAISNVVPIAKPKRSRKVKRAA